MHVVSHEHFIDDPESLIGIATWFVDLFVFAVMVFLLLVTLTRGRRARKSAHHSTVGSWMCEFISIE